MRVEVTGMFGRVSLLVDRVDFFSLKQVLREGGFRVFQNNPSYLTVKKGGSTANVYSNGKVTLFFRNKSEGERFVEELFSMLKNGGN